jgi:hypothetical protein
MSLKPIEPEPHEPNLVWKNCGVGTSYLLWRDSLLAYCGEEPTEEDRTLYANAALEVEAHGMIPTQRPGRDRFCEIIRGFRQRVVSSRP